MLSILEKKVKRTKLNKKKKIKAWSVVKKKGLRVTVGQKTIKEASIYYVSIWPIFSLYGN